MASMGKKPRRRRSLTPSPRGRQFASNGTVFANVDERFRDTRLHRGVKVHAGQDDVGGLAALGGRVIHINGVLGCRWDPAAADVTTAHAAMLA